MFNQFNQRRAFTPATPQRPLASQGPSSASSASSNSFGAQIRPDFMQPTSSTSNPQSSSQARMSRIKPDGYQSMSAQDQRTALYDQARQQTKDYAYQTPRDVALSALPAGLSERQRMDFDALRRTDPLAAQKQLQQYQRTADIRYNKPGTPPPPTAGSGLTYRRPPGGPTGPRRTFGA